MLLIISRKGNLIFGKCMRKLRLFENHKKINIYRAAKLKHTNIWHITLTHQQTNAFADWRHLLQNTAAFESLLMEDSYRLTWIVWFRLMPNVEQPKRPTTNHAELDIVTMVGPWSCMASFGGFMMDRKSIAQCAESTGRCPVRFSCSARPPFYWVVLSGATLSRLLFCIHLYW